MQVTWFRIMAIVLASFASSKEVNANEVEVSIRDFATFEIVKKLKYPNMSIDDWRAVITIPNIMDTQLIKPLEYNMKTS